MGARLAGLRPGELDEEQTKVYRAITGGPRAAGPQAFALTDEEGGDRAREMAILAVAAHWGSAFEREAHEAVGRTCGLTEPEMTALRDGGVPELADPVERAVLGTTVALIRHGTLSDEEYADAAAVVGERGLFELTTLVGYYAMLAIQLRVFAGEGAELGPEGRGSRDSAAP